MIAIDSMHWIHVLASGILLLVGRLQRGKPPAQKENVMKKVAIVTGASGGIGGSIAKRLAKDGFSVVVNYAGQPAPAQAVVADLEAAGGQGIAVQADVANAEDVERLFKESMDALGRPDVVVHCAGIMPLFTIASGDVAAFDRVIATNLRGTFLVFAQAARHVLMAGASWLSPAACSPSPSPTYGAYIASKAGVEGLVHVLANELRGRNITVNAVAPGQVRTDLFLKGKSDALIEELKKMNPLERLGLPEDMAKCRVIPCGS
jgi:3-oxoacyl-[acyl-carrier protein] reductase